MREVLLIGGSARVGKSVLAKEVRKEIDGQVISGDALTRGIRSSLKSEWLPDLFVDQLQFAGQDFEAISFKERIGLLRKRDKAQWQFVKNYLYAATKEADDDILYYGTLWPDYVTELEIGHRAIFLVDTSPDRATFLKSIRDTSPENNNNWMKDRDYSDEKIELWAEFDIARSKRIIELCELSNTQYFDLAIHGISKAQELSKQYLLGPQ